MENPFRGGSKDEMLRGGLSRPERAASNDSDSFAEKLEKSRMGAEIIMEHSKHVNAIEQFSRQHGNATSLTEEDCVRFLEEHPNCPYEPSMVLAIAERTQVHTPRTLH